MNKYKYLKFHLFNEIKKFINPCFGVKKSTLIAISISYIDFFIGIFINILITRIIIKNIGLESYGLWVTLASLLGYFGLLNFGMNDVLVKYVSEYRVMNRVEDLNRLFNTIGVFFIFIDIAIVFLSLCLAPFIPDLFNINSAMSSLAVIVFMILGCNFAFSLQSGILNSVLYGYERIGIIKIINIGQNILTVLLVFIVTKYNFGLVGVAFSYSITILLFIFFYWLGIKRCSLGIAIKPALFSWRILKSVAPYSLRILVLGLTSQILYRSHSIVISVLLGIIYVAPYAVTYQLTFMAGTLCLKISDVFYPTYSKLNAISDGVGLSHLLINTLKITMFIMTPMSIYLALFGHLIIEIWVGEEGYPGLSVLIVLVLMGFLHAMSVPFTVLKGIGQIREVTYSQTINAILSVGLSSILAFKMGLFGVALGGFIGYVLTDTWVVIWAAKKYINIPFRLFFVSGVLKQLLPGIPVLIFMLYARDLFGSGLDSLFIGLILTFAIYALLWVSFLSFGAVSKLNFSSANKH